MIIKELKKDKNNNKYFTLINKKGVESKTIYFINFYDRGSKKYSISPVDDVNKEKFVNATQLINNNVEF